MKFCMMSYTLSRQHYGVDDIIRITRSCRMTAIDWVTTYGCSPRHLRRQCEAAGLTIACYTFFLTRLIEGRTDWQDDAGRELSVAAELGVPLIMVPTPPIMGIGDRNENRCRWMDALAWILPRARNAGLTVSVENYPGSLSPFVTADDFLTARRDLPELMLTFDSGNAAGGEAPVTSLQRCLPYVVHVHFKDWTVGVNPAPGAQRMLDGRYYTPALVGEGGVDNAGCLAVLRQGGYQGMVNIEYESDVYPAEIAVKKAMAYLSTIPEAAGCFSPTDWAAVC